ncbi:hypothetical protein DZF91_08900, partial [Actinomadura logoneensis]
MIVAWAVPPERSVPPPCAASGGRAPTLHVTGPPTATTVIAQDGFCVVSAQLPGETASRPAGTVCVGADGGAGRLVDGRGVRCAGPAECGDRERDGVLGVGDVLRVGDGVSEGADESEGASDASGSVLPVGRGAPFALVSLGAPGIRKNPSATTSTTAAAAASAGQKRGGCRG